MQVVNLLNFLNNVNDLYTLEFTKCSDSLINYLDFLKLDEQFTKSIDLGIIYVNQKTFEQFIIVDGLNRILSLSLLLHAICECYKKTTSQNTKAIKTIRTKYLIKGDSKLKLHMNAEDSNLFLKILNGERLSGAEKSKPMFIQLHKLWAQIKDEKLSASHIFKMLQKINVTIVETEDVSKRDLYYVLNKDKRNINQLKLIDDFLRDKKITKEWEDIKALFKLEKDDLKIFLKDFFLTKFNYRDFNFDNLYEYFKNYFETMLSYQSIDVIMSNFKRTANLYYNILYTNFKNEDIKKVFINIKRHDGSDTYSYLLNVYEDYYTGNISESIFIEILNTIDEYLINRQKSGKNIEFNELVQYLNTLISYK